jgi:arsenite methyltransferase
VVRKLAMSFACLSLAAAQTAHQHHPPQSTGEYARVLEYPQRDQWQKPHEVVMALDLKSDDSIADIGAGTGYFARRFAHHTAKVYAVDVDPSLLEVLRRNAPANVISVLAQPDDPKLPPRSVDVVFFCDVLHHIQDRAQYLPKLKAALKPGGRVAVVDFYRKDLPIGPPADLKLSEGEVIAEFKAAGFRLSKKHDFLPYQYFLVFEPAPEK